MSNMIIGESLVNIPWEDKPQGCSMPVWRSKLNPILTRDAVYNSNSIFNSAVVPYKGEFRGVFRSDNTCRIQRLHSGKSKDGIHWEIEQTPIRFEGADSEIAEFVFGYDPRVCFIEDRYYVTWCNGYHGPTIGLAYTFDFEKFYQLENVFLPFNRNGVMFPKKINGNYAILSRPSDAGHTAFGDIFYSESPDLTFWGKHRHVMAPDSAWDWRKIGAGPIPIETKEGWLLFYHGVLESCSGLVYSMGAAILDRDKPWKVKYRAKPYLLSPQTQYECVGDVPNVVFPCAALADADTGRIALYYGAADTVVAMAFCQADEIVDFIKTHQEME